MPRRDPYVGRQRDRETYLRHIFSDEGHQAIQNEKGQAHPKLGATSLELPGCHKPHA